MREEAASGSAAPALLPLLPPLLPLSLLLLLLLPLGGPVNRPRRLGSVDDDGDGDRDVAVEMVDARCSTPFLLPGLLSRPRTAASCLRVELSRVRPAAVRQPDRSIVTAKEVQGSPSKSDCI